MNAKTESTVENVDTAKMAKLCHYAEKPLTRFTQYDVFINNWGDGDDLFSPDEDGDSLCSGRTDELMSGVYGVRVLITDQASKADVLRALKKIRNWIKADGIYKGESLDQLEVHNPDIPF